MLVRSLKNLASQLAQTLVSFADRIFLVGLLVRQWGPATYSDWLILVAASGLLGLADPGFQIFNANRLAAAWARGEKAAYAQALGFGLTFYIALAAVMALGVGAVIAIPDLAALFKLQRLDANAASLLFALLGAACIARTCRASISQIYRSRGEFHRGVLIDTTVSAAIIAGAATGALSGASPLALGAIYCLGEAVFGWGLTLADLTTRYRDFQLTPRWPRAEDVAALRARLGWYALMQGGPLAWLHAPIMILGALGLGGVAVASFAVQRTLVNFGRSLIAMLSMSTGVEIARLALGGAQDEVTRAVSALSRATSALAGALGGGVLTFGPAVIAVWTGRSDLSDMAVLGALVAPAALAAAATPLSMLCMYADRPRPAALAQAAQTALGIALGFAGGRSFGLAGAAAGLAFGETVASALILPLLSARSFGVDYAMLLLKSLGVAGATGVIGAASGWAALHLVGAGSLLQLAAALTLWALMSLAPIGYLALTREARARVAGMLRRPLARTQDR